MLIILFLIFGLDKVQCIDNNKVEVVSKCETGVCNTSNVCFIYMDEKEKVVVCSLQDGSHGVCCNPNPDETYEAKIQIPTNTQSIDPERVKLPPIGDNDLKQARQSANDYLKRLDKHEDKLREKGLLAKPKTKEYAHQNYFGSNPIIINLNRNGQIELQTSIQLKNKFKLDSIQSSVGLPRIRFSKSLKLPCPQPIKCELTKYRSADGSCNNLNDPSWGKSFTRFWRLLPPSYSDGLNKPRVSVVGGTKLPSARVVSAKLAPDINSPSSKLSLAFMQFGQFLDHDLTLAATTRTNNNEAIRCCNATHPECFEIEVPADDPFYGQFGVRCMSFVRSAVAQKCELGPREQINQITSYIDGSQVYGSNLERSLSLRTLKGGRLKTSEINDEPFLPFDKNRNSCAIPQTEPRNCFVAGDGRVNENSLLTVFQTIWLREHNRIANELSLLNPEWDDEKLYQESRRIVIAELQNIVYKEFLPPLIGKSAMLAFDLNINLFGHIYSYSSSTNAGIISSFATAAYRQHTLIQGMIKLIDSTNSFQTRQLHTQFNNPSLLYENDSLQLFIRGCTEEPSQNGDRYFTTEVTNHLFQRTGQFGLDLVSLTIQRGRDHGLPSYIHWRRFCKLPLVNSFDDLKMYMNPKTIEEMKKVYKSVEDIDLFIAGVSEYPLNDALLGPTFACIVAEQFRRLKYGDRFWFENGRQSGSFNLNQLQELRKSSLARVFCDNSKVEEMQPLALFRTDWFKPLLV